MEKKKVKTIYDLEDRSARFAKSCRDFVRKLPKEAKESRLWLQLCEVGEKEGFEKERLELIDESTQLRKIYTTIYDRSS